MKQFNYRQFQSKQKWKMLVAKKKINIELFEKNDYKRVWNMNEKQKKKQWMMKWKVKKFIFEKKQKKNRVSRFYAALSL